MSLRWLPVVALLSAGLVACGDETSLWVEVDLGDRVAGTEVDLIHLELRDAGEPLIGRNFELTAEDSRPSFDLTPGGRTPSSFELVAFAYLDSMLQGESPPLQAGFRDGERQRILLRIRTP